MVERVLPKHRMGVRFPSLALCLLILGSIAGCATAPVSTLPPKIEGIPGIYHKVEKGQTLWRISKMYNIDLDTLVKINRIPDSASIEIGQMILIPQTQKQIIPPAISASEEDFIWPAKGRVTGVFGHVYADRLNKGINIQPYENTEVYASRSGKVVFCAPSFKNYGKTIIIDHGDGFSSVYSGNAQLLVAAGDNVRRGSVIAKLNNSGTKPYLHFEIRKGHFAQNPKFYLSD